MKQAAATDTDIQSLMQQAVPTAAGGVSMPGHVTSAGGHMASSYLDMPVSYTQWMGSGTADPTTGYSRK